ncbi:hypothetical protein BX600DRAFT_528737 [Xylariales sp. PMI_506]|nr:hypothetical protein BX600DRAFT_528737 [Xylariales sp. PMI_506]
MVTSKSLDMGPGPSQLRTQLRTNFFTRPQQPPKSTDLSGRVAIITGASTGLGATCAHHLLSMQLSHLIIAVRSIEKGEGVAKKLRAKFPSARIEVWALEMTSYSSVQAFARRVETDLPRLDIAILNAAIFHTQFIPVPSTGNDEMVQVNYLSTFLLAIFLLPLLQTKRAPDGPPGRLTIVGSSVALSAKFPNRNARPLLASYKDPFLGARDFMERYSSSKLLGQLFFVRLLDYLPSSDEVIMNIVDPGLCQGSDLPRNLHGISGAIHATLRAMCARTLEEGAWAYVDAVVVKGKESHGSFCMDWGIWPFADIVYKPEGQAVMDALWNETLAELQFAGVQEILKKLKEYK